MSVDGLTKRQKIILTYTLKPYNKSNTQIQELVKCSRSTVYIEQEKLVKLGHLKRDEFGNLIRDGPIQRTGKLFNNITQTKFGEDEDIIFFIESLKRSDVNWKAIINKLWIVCETLQIKPTALLGPEVQTQHLVDMFEKELKAGKAKYILPNAKFAYVNKEKTSVNPYLKSIMSFRERRGITTAKGYLEVIEQRFDSYKRIRLNDIERKLAIQYFAGLGEIWKILFILHHELGVRADTLFNLKPVFEKRTMTVDDKTCEYFVCYAHETKQNHDYEKPIITPEAKEVVTKLENGKPLNFGMNKDDAKQFYNSNLKKFFASIGKIQLGQDGKPMQYERGTQEFYYVIDPTHAIRHSCVHKLMRMTGFRSEVVASFFWDVPETLSIYQKTSLDEILQQGTCLWCNKPKDPDPRYEIFCTLRHAVAYYSMQDLNKVEQNSLITPQQTAIVLQK